MISFPYSIKELFVCSFFYKDTTKAGPFQFEMYEWVRNKKEPPKQPVSDQSDRKPLPMISLVLVMNIKE